MAASGGTILKQFYDEAQKMADRHKHALDYAPGMDHLEFDDWKDLKDCLENMQITYTKLHEKYMW